MSNKKFTDEEIKSSLEVIATTRNCNECKIRNCKWGTCNCSQITANAALDLINRQEAEIEKLTDKLRVARIAAYMDFIEKLKEKQASPTHTMDKRIVSFQMIEDTVLELIEEDFPDIEKLVFPTREEAEQTLRERESK
jgi:hypothetical protein